MKQFSHCFRLRASFLTVLFLLGLSPLALAQRAIGSRTLVLDDGTGNMITVQSAPGATGTFTFPNGGGTIATLTFLSSNYLPLAGGTMSGDINMNGQNITNGGTITAGGFSGSGASLTSLTGGNITAGSVTGTQIASNAVSAAKMADDGTTGNVLTSNGGTPHWVAPTSFTPAYFDAQSSNFVTIANGAVVPIFSSFATGFIPSGGGAFTATFSGTYMVEWTVENITAGNPTFTVCINGVPAGIGPFDCYVSTVTHGNAIMNMIAGDVITLVNSSGASAVIHSSGGAAATLSAMRIQ